MKTIKLYTHRHSGSNDAPTSVGLRINREDRDPLPNLQQVIIMNSIDGNVIRQFLPSASLRVYEVPLPKPIISSREAQFSCLVDLFFNYLDTLIRSKQVDSPNLQLIRISGCPPDEGFSVVRRTFYDTMAVDHGFEQDGEKFKGGGVQLELLRRGK
jgi:hypothetical protein